LYPLEGDEMRNRPVATMLFVAGVFAVTGAMTAGPASASAIYQFSTGDSTLVPDDGYDASFVSIDAIDLNVTAPADGTELAAGNTGLNRFWNSEWAGFDVSAGNGTAIDNATEFGTGYWALTVSAKPGYQLDLTSLDLGAARGGTSGTRFYELYAAVDGGSFTFGDTPIDSSPGGNETGTRTAPRAASVDLTGPTYQGIDSITFRFYPLTPATGNTMGFDGWALNGEVVPEPSTLALTAFGLLGLLRRRGRGRR
jgi:hypothetical protein